MAWQQGYFDGVDEETASLIVQLQREDIEGLACRGKGKQREGDVSDSDLALRLCLEELNLFEPFRADLQMARSVGSAVITDAVVLNEASRLEQQANLDRELASRLQGLSMDPTPELTQSGSSSDDEDLDEETLAKVQARRFAAMLKPGRQSGQSKAESSKWAASRKIAHLDKSSHCVACSDDKPWYDVVKAPCGDEYCTDCVSTLFENSITDESLYPPRCCRQEIPMKLVKHFLKPGLAHTFAEKKVELDTKNRTYCSAPSCSSFIPSDHIVEDVATCPQCARPTCVTCKTAAHRGDCPNDTNLQQLLATVEDEGWQRCYQCSRLVDLETGCNHMTCRCNAQFCYVCGEPWKTCECPQWNEDRLMARATRLADRERDPRRRLHQPPEGLIDPEEEELQVPPLPAAARGLLVVPRPKPGRIAQIAQRLRDNHECLHRTWSKINGPHNCEECHFRLPQYIFECRQCQLQACWRCRKNRL